MTKLMNIEIEVQNVKSLIFVCACTHKRVEMKVYGTICI